jgi:hypothetical protein
MLLASKSYAEGGLGLILYAARLLDEQETADSAGARDEARLLLDVLTPIVKAWPSQWCLKADDYAIQVHGGYVYSREYPVEQFYRDNRLNPIHEGTDGIQALDLLGRKVIMRDGAGLALLVRTIRAAVARAPGDLARMGSALDAACARLGPTWTTAGCEARAGALRIDTLDKLRTVLGANHPETINMERGRRAECDIEPPEM